MRRVLIVTAALLASGLAHAAGQVEVRFVDTDRFADIGRGSGEVERNTRVLGDHLKQLARRLPDGQTLRVEVLDVDLAGELYPFRRAQEIRLLRGTTDWPRMTLRYTLMDGTQTLGSGEESIADMDYLRGRGPLRDDQALAYDRRLIERWFDERIAAASGARR